MRIYPTLLAAGMAFLYPMTDADAAVVLQSIDLTAKEQTNWATSTVRLDFGPGVGMGSISFSSVNSGYFQTDGVPSPYNASPYSSYDGPTTLSNGDVYA
ncbi:MAG: hypothetical protein EOP85_13145, partial [Verrucomicrobiaceae bacterium]